MKLTWMTIVLVIWLRVPVRSETPIYIAEQLGSCSYWKAIFYSSGFVHEENANLCEHTRKEHSQLIRVTQKQFRELEKVFTKADFRSLPDHIRRKDMAAFDYSQYSITEFYGKEQHSSSSTSIELGSSPEEAARFLDIWNAINEIVKDPYSEY